MYPSLPLLPLPFPPLLPPHHSITVPVPGCGALISLLKFKFKPSTFLGVPIAILLALPLLCLICSKAASLLIPPGVAGAGLKNSSEEDLRGIVMVVVVPVVISVDSLYKVVGGG